MQEVDRPNVGGDLHPLISIVVRSMDRAVLKEALRSLAHQSYDAVEVVVVNAKGGAHTDLTGCCGNRRVRIANQDGTPLSRPRACNAGLALAEGSLIAFLDDDDTLDTDHLRGLVVAMVQHGGQSVVFAGVRCMDRDDPDQTVSRIFGEPLHSTAQLLAGNFIPIHAPLFPRYLLENARFDETLDTYEDWDFWLQLAHQTPFVYTGHVSATYYTGGTSGVSPVAPDWSAVSKARQKLYKKWLQIAPDDFKQVCDMYHQATAELKTSREALGRVESVLSGTQCQLEEVLASTSWALTRPLRLFKHAVRRWWQ